MSTGTDELSSAAWSGHLPEQQPLQQPSRVFKAVLQSPVAVSSASSVTSANIPSARQAPQSRRHYTHNQEAANHRLQAEWRRASGFYRAIWWRESLIRLYVLPQGAGVHLRRYWGATSQQSVLQWQKKKKKGICRYKSGHEIKPWRYSCSEAKKIKDEFPHNFLSLFLQVIEFDDGSGSVLRIQPLRTPRDEAIYECHASNSAGEITASTRLSVLRGQSGGVSTPSSFPNCTPLLTSSFWAISRCWGEKRKKSSPSFFWDSLLACGHHHHYLIPADLLVNCEWLQWVSRRNHLIGIKSFTLHRHIYGVFGQFYDN